VEGAEGRSTILGTAAAALQSAAVRGRRALGGEDMAAFPLGDDAGVAGNHDRFGVARECLLQRGVSCGNVDPECYEQRIVEQATVGRLGGGNTASDPLRELLDCGRDLSFCPAPVIAGGKPSESSKRLTRARFTRVGIPGIGAGPSARQQFLAGFVQGRRACGIAR